MASARDPQKPAASAGVDSPQKGGRPAAPDTGRPAQTQAVKMRLGEPLPPGRMDARQVPPPGVQAMNPEEET